MSDSSTFEDLEFYDLLIEPSGCFFKNLQGSSRVLTPVPSRYLGDVEGIKEALKTLESEQKPGAEFCLEHKGIKYRTAKTDTVSGDAYVMRKGQPKVADIKKVGLPNYLLANLLIFF